ncbi:MAG: hypothetical protein OXF27_15920 [Acidobacteria bacterium]|nr:hypothetical protein [Acidobacteriota bacterium]
MHQTVPSFSDQYKYLAHGTLVGISREDAASGHAELEHVPPLKAGKPHITVLTCSECNRMTSSGIDKAAIEALRQKYDGTLRTKEGTTGIKIGLSPPVRADRILTMTHPQVNRPVYLWPTRKQQLPPLPRETFQLSWNTRKAHYVKVGLLKVAYLAVFALMGVQFAQASALRRVREQIAQPDRELLRNYCAVTDRPTGRAVCVVYNKGRTCWGVDLDGFLVIVPSMDDHEWDPQPSDFQTITRVRALTRTFGASRRYLFPDITEFPTALLGADVARVIETVGSMGWELTLKAGDKKVHLISVGGKDGTLRCMRVNPSS